MKKVIVIRGPLGIGKSTISKLVAKKINGKCFSIDNILDDHNLHQRDEEAGCIAKSSFVRANEIILPNLKENLENNIPVVIDGNFYWKGALMHLLK